MGESSGTRGVDLPSAQDSTRSAVATNSSDTPVRGAAPEEHQSAGEHSPQPPPRKRLKGASPAAADMAPGIVLSAGLEKAKSMVAAVKEGSAKEAALRGHLETRSDDKHKTDEIR